MVFIEYIPGNSFFHRMDVRPKIVWLAAVVILCIVFNHPVALLPLLLFVCSIGVLAEIPYKRIWRMLKPLLPLILFIVAFTGFTGPPVEGNITIFEIFGLKFTVSGVMLGAGYVMRLLIMVISLSIVTLTTPLEAFLGLLTLVRAPYELAFALATGIRFVPTLENELLTIMDAQKVRGVELEKISFLRKLKAQIAVMVPMIVGGIRKSETLTQAMLARGFGASKKRTMLYELRMRGSDYAFCAIFAALLIFGILLRLLGYGTL
jgi:energy-coupling factor transport system permease protein